MILFLALALALEPGDDAPTGLLDEIDATTVLVIRGTSVDPVTGPLLDVRPDEPEVVLVGAEHPRVLHALEATAAFDDAWLSGASLPQGILVHDGVVLWSGDPRDASLERAQKTLAEQGAEAVLAEASRSQAAHNWVGATQEAQGAAALLSLADAQPEGDPLVLAQGQNSLAWELTSMPTATRKHHKRAWKLAKQAATADPHSAAILDTYARTLWNLGKAEQAFEVQQAAVASALGTQWEGQLNGALEEYAAVLGKSMPETPTRPWSGSINAAGRTDAPLLIVAPQGAHEQLESMAKRYWDGARVVTPSEVTEEQRTTHVLRIYGSQGDNPLIDEVLESIDWALDDAGLSAAGERYEVASPFLVGALPNPWNPELPALVYVGSDGPGAVGLHSVFHGPTQIVLGESEGKVLKISANTRSDGGDLRIALGPAELTKAEILEDIASVRTMLESDYAGYEAMLRDGWLDHAAAIEASVTGPMSWLDATDLIANQLLRPHVQDTHFSYSGKARNAEGGMSTVNGRLVQSLEVWFADELPDDLEGIELVPGPHEVEEGVAYLFPSLDAEGPTQLLGAFHPPGTQAPTLEVGEEQIPLHAVRSRGKRSKEAWELDEHDGLPRLAVRTMNTARIEGVPKTAESLRTRPAVLLDLRRNGGGSDRVASAWVNRFDDKTYTYPPGFNVVAGAGAQSDRTEVWLGSKHGGDAPAYEGKLLVLTDDNVASSGETFTSLARQVTGAVHVGSNTAGCTAYGNVVAHDPLPHSRLEFRFGHTAFLWSEVQPLKEGVGMFPQIWLDHADPVGFLRGLSLERIREIGSE